MRPLAKVFHQSSVCNHLSVSTSKELPYSLLSYFLTYRHGNYIQIFYYKNSTNGQI